ncbi:unnamed protein product [Brachionus calyciflorus]|uniref:Thioredoxin domain-containing protein n=1 Tax=Brachionus calyciflorus TaxID=104777 RepID=A0A814E416_9BILA|nr:unnamed protein product [Brachionus calyciflorus]
MFNTTRLKVILSIFLVCLIQNSYQSDSIKEKHISAIVSAKWTETPFLLETGEFIFRNYPDVFWKFAKDVSTETNHFSSVDSFNNQTYFEELLKKAAEYISPMQFDLLKLSLSIRTFSPAIEMTRKLAEDALKLTNQDCFTFVDIHGQVTCNVEEILTLIESANMDKKPFTYQFDKHFDFKVKQKQLEQVSVVLYAQIGTQDFLKFHERIIELASKNSKYAIDYILRNNYLPSKDDSEKVALSGYGVELDIKSTEYKAKDDTKYLIESTQELAPLKAWQMQDLSIQAAQRIIDSEPTEALSLLEDLSQNYPIRARPLSKIQVRKDLRKSLKKISSTFESTLNLEPGSGGLYLNGLDMSLDTVDIFSLSSVLKKEAKLLESLSQTGLNVDQVKDLIYLDISSKATDYGVDLRDSSIQWLNDLEKDKKYSYWSRNVHDILRPTYPGMLRSIAKNFFNLVFVIDPAKDASKSLLKTAESFYVNDIPIRIGFVFVTNKNDDGNSDPSVALFRAHNYIKEKSNPIKALAFITDVYAKSPKGQDLTSDLVIKEFKRRFPKEKNLEDIFGPDSDYDEGRKLTMEYFNKIGLKSIPKVFINGFPLSDTEIEQDAFEESVITKIMHLTSEIQMPVYKGEINDRTNIMDWLMSKDVIMPRLNPRVLSQDREYLTINELSDKHKNYVKNLKYLTESDKNDMHLLTLWLVCDPDTERGRQLLYDAINYHESSKMSTKLAFILVKTTDDSTQNSDLIKKVIDYSVNNLNPRQAYKLIKQVIREKNFNDLKSGKKTLDQIEIKKVNEI